jgi:hypothetical protein
LINKPLSAATRGASPRVALVTCAELPDLDPDDRLLIGPLAGHGVTAVPAVWDDPTVDWDGFDLVVLRSPWDYSTRREEFVAWAQTVGRLANPAKVVTDNTDKRYLAGLAAAGVPVVTTRWVEPDAPWSPAEVETEGEYVIKPAISAGSNETGRYDLADPRQRRLAGEHVGRLHAAGKVVMIQPYLSAVDHHGETALVFLGGRYSHTIRKGPMLDGPYQGMTGLYRPERIEPREPGEAERDTAARVLAAAPGDLLYARVDLIPGPDGAPLLVELELTEPSLFLAHAPGAAQRFADAIAGRVLR